MVREVNVGIGKAARLVDEVLDRDVGRNSSRQSDAGATEGESEGSFGHARSGLDDLGESSLDHLSVVAVRMGSKGDVNPFFSCFVRRFGRLQSAETIRINAPEKFARLELLSFFGTEKLLGFGDDVECRTQ